MKTVVSSVSLSIIFAWLITSSLAYPIRYSKNDANSMDHIVLVKRHAMDFAELVVRANLSDTASGHNGQTGGASSSFSTTQHTSSRSRTPRGPRSPPTPGLPSTIRSPTTPPPSAQSQAHFGRSSTGSPLPSGPRVNPNPYSQISELRRENQVFGNSHSSAPPPPVGGRGPIPPRSPGTPPSSPRFSAAHLRAPPVQRPSGGRGPHPINHNPGHIAHPRPVQHPSQFSNAVSTISSSVAGPIQRLPQPHAGSHLAHSTDSPQQAHTEQHHPPAAYRDIKMPNGPPQPDVHTYVQTMIPPDFVIPERSDSHAPSYHSDNFWSGGRTNSGS